MLLELKIRNLAIIESVTIQFGRGLNVLTGETGAGKSMLLTALGLVLGGRSDRSLVRSGQKEAWTEALFEVEAAIEPLLRESGIELEPGEPLALRRVVQHNGRSRAYVNCVSVPASLLRRLAPHLIDFGRQHAQSVLMNPEHHLGLLDRYADAEGQRSRVERKYRALAKLHKEKEELSLSRHTRAERVEFLHFQHEAICKVDPQPGEDKELLKRLEELSSCEKRRVLAKQAEQLLFHEDNCTRDSLAHALVPLEDLASLDGELESLVEELHSALILVEESARTLQGYQRNLPLDSAAMHEVQERLDELHRLQEKHGGGLDDVLQRLDAIEDELEELALQQRREVRLDGEIETAEEALWRESAPLRTSRLEAAKGLAQRVEQELADLAMRGARFGVRFVALRAPEGVLCGISPPDATLASCLVQGAGDTLTQEVEAQEPDTGDEDEQTLVPGAGLRLASWGAERGQFYLAANEGEDLYPLERVASGGELSRILLALKCVLADASAVQTFVFDEIDAGVAGAAATKVARKLKQIASQQDDSQILCVSHTPQIAAEADHHFHVRKQTRDGRTRSAVVPLNHEERVLEVARMLAGDQSMEHALQLARELVACPPVALAS